MASETWNFGTPFTTWHGDDPSQTAYAYYDAGPTDIAGKTWFRPSFVHELLHAFGFNHTLTRYSFINHRGNGGFPWANRERDDAVRPLPDEIATLRRLYPASDSRSDVAALNTWYAPPGDSDDDAAWQVKLCTPSLGTAWSPTTSDGPCGVNGSNVISVPVTRCGPATRSPTTPRRACMSLRSSGSRRTSSGTRRTPSRPP